MNTTKNILVSGASGIVGYGILDSLQRQADYRLYGMSIYTDTVAEAFSDEFLLTVNTDSENYIDWLCSAIKDNNIHMAIPSIEADLYKWNEDRDILASCGAVIMLNNPSLISLCKDKWDFYQTLQSTLPELAIPSMLPDPDSYHQLVKQLGSPFLIKPRRGFASRGIAKIHHETAFRAISCLNVMAQEIIGDDEEEYTTSAFFDKDSNLCCFMTLKRKLAKEGFTQTAQTANIPDIEDAIIALAKVLKPIGPTNFQFRRHNGQLKLLEINPRISSATSIRKAFGYNESLMSVRYFLDGKLPTQPLIRSGKAIRYTEDYIIYDN